MITHTISVTEVIWTLCCTIGFTYNFRILSRAIGDLTIIRRRKINNVREYSARLTVLAYSSWTIVQVSFLIAGIIAMTIPPSRGQNAVNALQILITTIFLLISFILAVTSYFNERGRRKLIAMIEKLEA